MTGCWFSRHSSLGLRTVGSSRVVQRDEADPAGAGAAAFAAGVAAGAVARLIGSRPRSFAVVPDPVGVADADLGHPVLLGDRAGHLAVERGVELRLDVQLGRARPAPSWQLSGRMTMSGLPR